jgi:1-acyl-sn-glycerol-3-phosphate acyltransferase
MLPTPIRRPLTITAWLVMSTACLLLSPLLLVLAWLCSIVSRKPQPLIFARLVIVYFGLELATLVACGGLWVASIAGLLMRTAPFQRMHYRLLRWFVHRFAQRWCALLEISVAEGPSPEAVRALEADAPLLFFSRHAGPGDTVVLVDLLLTRFDRLPSVVFKETIAIDPSVDLIGHRLPHAILDTAKPDECEARIEEVASELHDRGVLLLFPEGGNFTPERRRRAIRKLWSKDRRREAAQAEHMTHVLPPRPTGALAALRGNPGAGVIFAAHTGLGLAAFPRQLWRAAPFGRTLQTRMWLWPAADRPTDPDEQEAWIYDCWRLIDQWVEDQGTEEPDAAAMR